MLRAGRMAPAGKAGSEFGAVGNSGSAGVKVIVTCPLRPPTPPLTMVKMGCCWVKRPNPPRSALLIAPDVPGEANARIEVVRVGAGRSIGDVLDDFDVVAQTEIKRQVVTHAPVVLHERCDHR